MILAGRDMDDLARSARDVSLRTGQPVEAMAFDAVDYESHASFAAEVAGRASRLSVFLLFGVMPDQAAAERAFALARQTIEVNYLGAVSVLLHLASVLETRGEGRVVVLSSVAGDRGRLKNHIYGSAKAGLNAFVEGLRARLYRRGVGVTLVKAGFIDTEMSFGHPGMFLVARPEDCASACLAAARSGRAPCSRATADTAKKPKSWMTLVCCDRTASFASAAIRRSDIEAAIQRSNGRRNGPSQPPKKSVTIRAEMSVTPRYSATCWGVHNGLAIGVMAGRSVG